MYLTNSSQVVSRVGVIPYISLPFATHNSTNNRVHWEAWLMYELAFLLLKLGVCWVAQYKWKVSERGRLIKIIGRLLTLKLGRIFKDYSFGRSLTMSWVFTKTKNLGPLVTFIWVTKHAEKDIRNWHYEICHIVYYLGCHLKITNNY